MDLVVSQNQAQHQHFTSLLSIYVIKAVRECQTQ